MATLQIPSGRAIYLRGVVACQKCAAPIYVHKLKSLANEFSLLCSRCGHRGHYLKRNVTVEKLPERRRKPRPER